MLLSTGSNKPNSCLPKTDPKKKKVLPETLTRKTKTEKKKFFPLFFGGLRGGLKIGVKNRGSRVDPYCSVSSEHEESREKRQKAHWGGGLHCAARAASAYSELDWGVRCMRNGPWSRAETVLVPWQRVCGL
eukprot:1769791-Amphidinium_carterae.1